MYIYSSSDYIYIYIYIYILTYVHIYVYKRVVVWETKPDLIENIEALKELKVPPALPPWIQPRGKLMVSLLKSHSNATSRRQHLWEIDLRFAPGLPPGWNPILRGSCLIMLTLVPVLLISSVF